MGVYDKLLKKHYTPPFQHPLPQERQQVIENTLSKPPTTPRGQEVMGSLPHDSKTPRPQGVKESRVIKRHTYELYKDQVEALQRVALREKINGGEGNQSRMVREAIDEYLKKRGTPRGQEVMGSLPHDSKTPRPDEVKES
jgi:hypothetical protein